MSSSLRWGTFGQGKTFVRIVHKTETTTIITAHANHDIARGDNMVEKAKHASVRGKLHPLYVQQFSR